MARRSRSQFLRQMIFDGQGRPAEPIARPSPVGWSENAITGSCLGHSTILLNFLGARVLIDPVFSRRVGPGVGPLVIGPKRRIQPALRPRDVGHVDVLVLSHAHFDHFDAPSLRRFPRDVPVITATDTGDLLRRFHEIHALAWQQSATLTIAGAPLIVTALPVAHWGARMLKDTHRGYNAYLLERGGRRILFGGDTAYTQAFRAAPTLARGVDLAIMPIGAYDPWIRAHCTPEQAAAMADDAGARYFVPVHHETFRLSDEAMHEPAQRIRHVFAREPERLLATHVGQTFRIPV